MVTPVQFVRYAQLKEHYISKLLQKCENAQKYVDISDKKYIIKL